MKRFFGAIAAAVLFIPSPVLAQVHVNGYVRKDGTYVRPHIRSYPGYSPRLRGGINLELPPVNYDFLSKPASLDNRKLSRELSLFQTAIQQKDYESANLFLRNAERIDFQDPKVRCYRDNFSYDPINACADIPLNK